jgi:hypothetical protein
MGWASKFLCVRRAIRRRKTSAEKLGRIYLSRAVRQLFLKSK